MSQILKKELNEIGASNLSDAKFKTLIRILKKLSENFNNKIA